MSSFCRVTLGWGQKEEKPAGDHHPSPARVGLMIGLSPHLLPKRRNRRGNANDGVTVGASKVFTSARQAGPNTMETWAKRKEEVVWRPCRGPLVLI
jgi:hypothetical protein